MALKVSTSRVLKDALTYPANESFEESLGRAVRRDGGDYEAYVALISRVREAARDRGLSLRDAARWVADQP